MSIDNAKGIWRCNSESDLNYTMDFPIQRRLSDSIEDISNYALDISVYRRSGRFEHLYTLKPYECDVLELKEFADSQIELKDMGETTPTVALSKKTSLEIVSNNSTPTQRSSPPPALKITVQRSSLPPVASPPSSVEQLSSVPTLIKNIQTLRRPNYRSDHRRSLYMDNRSHSCETYSRQSLSSVSINGTHSRDSNLQFYSEFEIDSYDDQSSESSSENNESSFEHKSKRHTSSISESFSQSRSSVQTEFEIELAHRIQLYKNLQDTTTKPRIRARQPQETQITTTEFDGDSLQNEGIGGNFFMSEKEIEEIRKNVWKPRGTNMPKPSDVFLAYHTAWDTGKKGCAAYKIKTAWKSSIFFNKIYFFVMDGTDPINFLSIYSIIKNLPKENMAKKNVTVLSAMEIRDGIWNYTKGRIQITKEGEKKHSLILDGIPQHFIDAMIVCIREMEVYIYIYCMKWLSIYEQNAKNEEKKTPELVFPASPTDWAAYGYGVESKSSTDCPFSFSRRKPKSLIAPKAEAINAALIKLKNSSSTS